MTLIALTVYVGGLVAAFGVRTWLHRRRTGSSGLHGISGRPGSLRWWGGMSFVAAVVLGAAALLLAVTGVLPPPPRGTIGGAVAVSGLGVAIAGLLLVLAGQTDMGSSWRVGVDEGERTELIGSGLFGVVRNPIFTGMVAAQAGVTAMVPTWVSLSGLACLVFAVQVQVRAIEEPYLLATHGEAYRRYAGSAGRFVPLIGRWRSTGHEPARSDGD